MILSGFRLICSQCGSEKILEKSAVNKLNASGNVLELREGVQRKCLRCSNEAFIIFRTWRQKN